jgi:hypothetical protein
MAYKYSTGSLRQGDIYYEDDRLGEPTYIDFGMDTISLRPSGSAILNVSASNVGIGSTAPVTMFDAHFNSMAMDNDTGGGWVVKFGSGTLTAGKLYYLHTDGAWTATDADAATTGGDQLLGIALGSAPGTHGVLLRGFFDAHTYLDTHTSGKAVYIDLTAGQMTTTAPSATGDIIRIIGYCTSQSKVIYFNPSSTFVELS